MITHKQVYYSDFSIAQLFDLVMDIEHYPEFIPWCTYAKILEEPKPNVKIAELNATFAGFSEQYTSHVKSFPQKTQKDTAKISTDIITGPFKHLHSNWIFSHDKEKQKTKVEFYIEFEFSSKILQMMIGKLFEKASSKMLEAFEERAKKIYKNR
jgi:coenzyme Q-binding protein COQ10